MIYSKYENFIFDISSIRNYLIEISSNSDIYNKCHLKTYE